MSEWTTCDASSAAVAREIVSSCSSLSPHELWTPLLLHLRTSCATMDVLYDSLFRAKIGPSETASDPPPPGKRMALLRPCKMIETQYLYAI
eukprot:416951-Pleurochrysis_carterae.AAC.2